VVANWRASHPDTRAALSEVEGEKWKLFGIFHGVDFEILYLFYA